MNFALQDLVLTIDEASDLDGWVKARLGVEGISMTASPPLSLRTRSKVSVRLDDQTFWEGEVYVTGRFHNETYPVTPGTFAQELLRRVEEAFREQNTQSD